ncbi:hypothetical protein HaLaN_18552 [Haematococcus lacustris]|uniref:Uncharacterized protein n=1 Tax=Haematococcus lacustris TaxID=44745 RepID=A0A699ZFE2_HAELA|nr:hypothetical protein HaLaN_18552 [Haematococcus lacustris]
MPWTTKRSIATPSVQVKLLFDYFAVQSTRFKHILYSFEVSRGQKTTHALPGPRESKDRVRVGQIRMWRLERREYVVWCTTTIETPARGKHVQNLNQ